jgi:hypothetical protein
MNLNQIQQRNEKLQEAAARLTELLPGAQLMPFTTIIIRSCKKVGTIFPTILTAKTEMTFIKIMDRLENEMDEVVYALDKLAELNREHKNNMINDLVKYGYDLLSIYSMACDKIIERRVENEQD